MTAFVIAGHIGLAGEFLVIFFVFNVVDPQFDIMQKRETLQAVEHWRKAFTKRDLRMQTAVCLPQERENFVLLLQTRRLLLYALFQHRVAFGQFPGHSVKRLTQHGHFVASANVRALGKISFRHRPRDG